MAVREQGAKARLRVLHFGKELFATVGAAKHGYDALNMRNAFRTIAGMRIFSGSAKSRGFCLTRTDLVNRPDPLRYFWTNIGGWGSLFPMINSSESAYFVA